MPTIICKRRLFIALCLLLIQCLGPLPRAASAAGAEILLAGAASLAPALREVASAFEQTHPGMRVRSTFAASDVVLQQILQGAPIDVFVAADPLTMNRAQQAGVIEPGSRVDIARNRLVLIVPADSPLKIMTMQDLAIAAVGRIAIGKPETVPAGRYARSALEQAGLWQALQPRLIIGQNVRQVLNYVLREEVDAAFVFATDARFAQARVRIVQTVDSGRPILYPAARVKRPGQPAGAADFLHYLQSDPAFQIMARYGFLKAQPTEAAVHSSVH